LNDGLKEERGFRHRGLSN